MSDGGTTLRLSRRRWLGYDPGERVLLIAYDARDGLWQVGLADERGECLDSDLRSGLLQAAETDADDPWMVQLAERIEDDLRGRRT